MKTENKNNGAKTFVGVEPQVIAKTAELYKGDALTILPEMESECVDLIFIDPWYYPENQKTKNAFEDDIFWAITKKWMQELTRIIKKDGHIFISFSSQKMAKFEFLIGELSLPLKSRIVWHYRNAGGRCADKGQFGKTYEMIYHIGFGERLNFPEQWGDERFDVWTIAIPQSNFKDKKYHPFQKPLKLLERIITIGSEEGNIVLDPMMGSGTTGVVCRNTGRKFIGIENEQTWFDIAKQRIEDSSRFSL